MNYIDRELCRRSFGLAPEDIVKVLQGRVESVATLLDGVYIVGSSQLLNREGLETLAKVLRDELTLSR